MNKPSYAAYTLDELSRVNDHLFAARQEAMVLGMMTVVKSIDELRAPLTSKMREKTRPVTKENYRE